MRRRWRIVNDIDYSFNESLKDKFIKSISQYWPEVNPDKLHPDYTGIRPKITKPNETMKDFSIQTSTKLLRSQSCEYQKS